MNYSQILLKLLEKPNFRWFLFINWWTLSVSNLLSWALFNKASYSTSLCHAAWIVPRTFCRARILTVTWRPRQTPTCVLGRKLGRCLLYLRPPTNKLGPYDQKKRTNKWAHFLYFNVFFHSPSNKLCESHTIDTYDTNTFWGHYCIECMQTGLLGDRLPYELLKFCWYLMNSVTYILWVKMYFGVSASGYFCVRLRVCLYVSACVSNYSRSDQP